MAVVNLNYLLKDECPNVMTLAVTAPIYNFSGKHNLVLNNNLMIQSSHHISKYFLIYMHTKIGVWMLIAASFVITETRSHRDVLEQLSGWTDWVPPYHGPFCIEKINHWAKKRHGWVLNVYVLRERSQSEKLPTVSFQLHDILEKAEL